MARSFFERLTGTVRVRDSEPEAEQEKEAPLAASLAAAGTSLRPRKKEEADAAARNDREKVIHPVAAESGRPASNLSDENGEEGQLTVDIYDDGSFIVIQSIVGGVKPEDIDISLQDETLTVRGARRRIQEISEDNFYYRELYWGTFSRSIILPEEVDFQKAEASIKNGLLTVRLPKKDRGEKKIRVKVE